MSGVMSLAFGSKPRSANRRRSVFAAVVNAPTSKSLPLASSTSCFSHHTQSAAALRKIASSAALKAAGFRHKENGFKINGKRKNVWIHEDNHKVREKMLWAQDGIIFEG